MEKNLLIELLETGEKVSLYSQDSRVKNIPNLRNSFSPIRTNMPKMYKSSLEGLILSRKMVQKIDSSDRKEANVTG
mgnify:CR=1 FL=1